MDSNWSIPLTGLQLPGMIINPGIERQHEQGGVRHSIQQYPGMPSSISPQYTRVLPPVPADTTLSQTPQRGSYPQQSPHLPTHHPVRAALPGSMLSPTRPSHGTVTAPESKCTACGGAATFMCSACTGAQYCSTQCRVRCLLFIYFNRITNQVALL